LSFNVSICRLKSNVNCLIHFNFQSESHILNWVVKTFVKLRVSLMRVSISMYHFYFYVSLFIFNFSIDEVISNLEILIIVFNLATHF
jgi:hypothetical protein